ncbi:MAG: Asp-tRNA(Asn)/Glu-tRNA(Gln) amidotransferase subunit GatB, partial [Gaiellales bacterium]
DHGLTPAHATELNADPDVAEYFELVAAAAGDAKAAADWVLNQKTAVATVPADTLASLIRLIADGTITATIAKQVYALLEQDPSSEPAELVRRHGLASIGDDSELTAMVDAAIEANPQFVEQFRAGKEGVINALVGHVMKQSRGRADARRVQELMRSRLAG